MKKRASKKRIRKTEDKKENRSGRYGRGRKKRNRTQKQNQK